MICFIMRGCRTASTMSCESSQPLAPSWRSIESSQPLPHRAQLAVQRPAACLKKKPAWNSKFLNNISVHWTNCTNITTMHCSVQWEMEMMYNPIKSCTVTTVLQFRKKQCTMQHKLYFTESIVQTVTIKHVQDKLKGEAASSFCPFAPVESFLVVTRKVGIGEFNRSGDFDRVFVTVACPRHILKVGVCYMTYILCHLQPLLYKIYKCKQRVIYIMYITLAASLAWSCRLGVTDFALQQYGDACCGPSTAGDWGPQLAAEVGPGEGHWNARRQHWRSFPAMRLQWCLLWMKYSLSHKN